jgi:hypothetical protein
MLALEHHGPLQAVLFHVAFWHLNLAYFDRYALDSWPLPQFGVILWSLSASAHDWLPRETLSKLCASPVIGVLERYGISVRVRWRLEFFGPWSGSGFWNHEPNQDRQPTWSSAVYTERHRCLIGS